MHEHAPERSLLLRLAIACAVVVGILLGTSNAEASPWMIRHGYTGCAMCHADPSGGGVLTEYGRAQGDLLLRMHYKETKPEEEGEPSKTAGYLWGAVEPPEWLLLGGSLRSAFLHTTTNVEGAPATDRFLLMQADVLRGVAKFGKFRVGGSLGYLHEGGQAAWITSRPQDNLVSREHWVGVVLGEDENWWIRAGRMNLPFGIRNVEHNLWVRSSTRTDINDGQQHGVAASYTGELWRGEIMAIAGNFQLGPDEYRERGWVGFVERAFGNHWAVGLSTLGTWAHRARDTGVTTHRESHGLFVRGAPIEQVVVMAEADVLIREPAAADTKVGWTSYAQVDWQPKQGLHFLVTGETLDDKTGSGTSVGGWLSAWWFFLPHFDARLDGIVQNVPTPIGSVRATSILAQLHAYL